MHCDEFQEKAISMAGYRSGSARHAALERKALVENRWKNEGSGKAKK
jgi:hypothetical protein